MYVFLGDTQNQNNASDKIVIVGVYFYHMKFILFPILAATTLCHIGWIYKYARLARSPINVNICHVYWIGFVYLI